MKVCSVLLTLTLRSSPNLQAMGCNAQCCCFLKFPLHEPRKEAGTDLGGHFAVIDPSQGGEIGGFCTVESVVEPGMVAVRKSNHEFSSFLGDLEREKGEIYVPRGREATRTRFKVNKIRCSVTLLSKSSRQFIQEKFTI